MMASGPAGATDHPPPYSEATGNPAGAVGGYTQPTSPGSTSYAPVPAGYGTQGAAFGQTPIHGFKQENYNEYTGGYQGGVPAGMYSAPPGYQPVSQQPYGPNSTVIAVQQPPTIVVVGGCPACRVGVLEDDFTFLGVCCAILFFPLGILCCLAMRQRHCPNCGAIFS